MGEKMGFLTVILVFGIAVVPTLLLSFTSHVEGSKVLNISTEMQQMVSSEGGVTSKVQGAVDTFHDKGLDIEITDANGASVTGKVSVGETVYMKYEYNGFSTENKTTILRR